MKVTKCAAELLSLVCSNVLKNRIKVYVWRCPYSCRASNVLTIYKDFALYHPIGLGAYHGIALQEAGLKLTNLIIVNNFCHSLLCVLMTAVRQVATVNTQETEYKVCETLLKPCESPHD